MSIYTVRIKFTGGCFNCPFCPKEIKRKCQLTDEHIQWHFKKDPDAPIGVKIVFDPYKKRLKSCPLTKE